MKGIRLSVFLLIPVMFIAGTSFSIVKEHKLPEIALQDTVKKTPDGIYTGSSQASYSDEPYWGIVRIVISNGSFSEIKFTIRDSALHETFDGKYEKHFEGNPEYVQQSRNDWKGVQAYPKKLAEKQDINKVDAMSGATWSYNIFKASVDEALKSQK